MRTADKIRFIVQYIRNFGSNREFKKNNPTVILPMDFLMYESFKLDYRAYYEGGEKTCDWLIDLLSQHTELDNLNILDWGCGPARVVRHFPRKLKNNIYYGSDYNEKSIHWCKTNIQGVEFLNNHLSPPLTIPKGLKFDIIYAISIFTHLSEEHMKEWLMEFQRIMASKAILLFTLQGEAFMGKMSANEQQIFNESGLIVRGKVKEGNRVYASFHSFDLVSNILASSGYIILNFIPGEIKDWGISQDTYVVQKA